MWRKFFSQRGLSLLETAMAVVVLGLIALPIVRNSHVELVQEVTSQDMGTLNGALGGINQYFASGNSAYPCPADLSLKEGDPDFGKAGDCSNIGSIHNCNSGTWFSNGGICRTGSGASSVIIGGLPFADLKMSMEESLDFWGNKLIYAVSYSQTDSATYSTGNGTISVMSVDDPVSVANAAGTPMASNPCCDGVPDLLPEAYEIFIFSTGENGDGGVTSSGLYPDTCGNDNLRYEFENCDFDNVFFALKDPSNKDAQAFSTASGTQYFDDLTDQQEYLPVNTWYQHEDNSLYANADYVLTGATRVGVGTTEPDYALHVVGDVQAEVKLSGDGGHISTNDICDEDASSCFDPEIITGTEDSMNCVGDPSGPYQQTRGVMELSNSSVKCGGGDDATGNPVLHVDMTKFSNIACSASGMIANGFNASGELQCVMP